MQCILKKEVKLKYRKFIFQSSNDKLSIELYPQIFFEKNRPSHFVFILPMTILVNQFQNGIFKPEFIGFIYGKTKAVPDETLEAMKSYYFSESVANYNKQF